MKIAFGLFLTIAASAVLLAGTAAAEVVRGTAGSGGLGGTDCSSS